MSGEVEERGRWTVYVCEGCGWISDCYDEDPLCECDKDEWGDNPPEIGPIQVVPAASLDAALEALRELTERVEREWPVLRDPQRPRVPSVAAGAHLRIAAEEARQVLAQLDPTQEER